MIFNSPSVTMTSHTERYCCECKRKPVDGKALFCSAGCRKRAQRRKHNARLALPLAMYELGKIRDSIKRRERLPDFISDLNRLQAEIFDLLHLAGDEEEMARRDMLARRPMKPM